MNFIIYDIILLVIFAVFVSVFLYRNRKNLKREGLLFLYKASWGIKLINYIGNKYKRTLKVLSYVSIITGFILMGFMLYFLGRLIWIYLFFPEIVRLVKIPPIMPLIPYLPQVFKLNFLPPFYFTYWIVILAVIAISHEFAHGIFAAYNKIKIKTTGFGFFPFFLPVFLAAFVELDEKKMAKHKKLEQMTILSAGTFANVICAGVFLLVLWGFFSLAFIPGGVIFNSYSYNVVETGSINNINGINLTNPNYTQVASLINDSGFNNIQVGKQKFIITKNLFDSQKQGNLLALYYDAPAVRYSLGNIITNVDGEEINSVEELSSIFGKKSPGDVVYIKAIDNDVVKEYEITLTEDPETPGRAILGVMLISRDNSGIIGKISSIVTSFKDEHIYYKSRWDGWSMFIYDLLWWLVLISISVALVNMLPVGIFDGGRFFYLSVLGITRSQKIAKWAFSAMTYIFLFILALVMVFWAKSFF